MSAIKKKLQIKEGMRGTVTAMPKGVDLGVSHNRSGTATIERCATGTST